MHQPQYEKKKWKKFEGYNLLKSKQVPSQDEIAELVERCSNWDLELGALVGLCYLCGCRVHELLRYQYCKKYKQYFNPPIQASGLRVSDMRGKEFADESGLHASINLRVEKNVRMNKKMLDLRDTDFETFLKKFREQTIQFEPCEFIITYNTPDDRILKCVEKYTSQFANKPYAELFTKTYVNYLMKLKRALGEEYSFHIFRVFRAKVYSQIGLSVSELQHALRWKNYHMPLLYSQMTKGDVVFKLRALHTARIEDKEMW